MSKKAVFLSSVLVLLGCAILLGGSYLGQKSCDEELHNKNRWHGFRDEKTGCVYDHEHGDDPKDANSVFGLVGEWFGQTGREISYPWQTFAVGDEVTKSEVLLLSGGEAKDENDLKHEGYKWAVERDLPCTENYCVTDFRIQYHMHTTALDAPVRWHSASAEVRVCKDADRIETCGLVRTGGWFDFGLLVKAEIGNTCWEQINKTPENIERINLERDNEFVLPLDGKSIGLVDEFRCYQGEGVEWWGHGGSDFRFVVKVADADAQILSDGHGSIHSVENGKKMQEREVKIGYTLPINQIYTGRIGEDGKVNLPLGKKYINRFGELVDGCVTADLDCIPIEYSNIWVDQRRKDNFGFSQF